MRYSNVYIIVRRRDSSYKPFANLKSVVLLDFSSINVLFYYCSSVEGFGICDTMAVFLSA